MEPPTSLLDLGYYKDFSCPNQQPILQHSPLPISLDPTLFTAQLWTKKYCFWISAGSKQSTYYNMKFNMVLLSTPACGTIICSHHPLAKDFYFYFWITKKKQGIITNFIFVVRWVPIETGRNHFLKHWNMYVSNVNYRNIRNKI